MSEEEMERPITRVTETGPKRLGLHWIDSPYPVVSVGLTKILEEEGARVHVGRELPAGERPACIIFATEGVEGLSESMERLRQADPDAPILVFGLHLDLTLARAALHAGARGFIHAAMQPQQMIRALKVAQQGEIVAPRELLQLLIAEDLPGADILSGRQREILELVSEGLTNAQIARRLFLTESTIKQHLRAAYKLLGVRNRVEAAKLLHHSDSNLDSAGSAFAADR